MISACGKFLLETSLEILPGLSNYAILLKRARKGDSQLTVSRLLPVAWVGPGTARAPELHTQSHLAPDISTNQQTREYLSAFGKKAVKDIIKLDIGA